MKKISVGLLSILLVISMTRLEAQIRKIPAAVTDSFKQKYPAAINVEWKDKLTNYRADFKMDGESYQAKFANKGEWQQTEKTIAKDNLPSAVNDGLAKSKYSDWNIASTAHIEYKDGHIEYRMLIKKSDIEKRYLYFNDKGKLLRDGLTL